MNRREIDDIDCEFELWGNLCAFYGYALVDRPQDFPTPVTTLEEANEELRRVSVSRRLELINFGSDSLKALKTPLTPVLTSAKIEYRSYAVDDGLSRFLRGQGDLYIGRFPQRLDCARRGMTELVTSQNHPIMMGIDCLVSNEVAGEDDIVEKVSVSWSKVCCRLKVDEGYCRDLYTSWQRSCRALGIYLTFSLEDFLLVTHQEPAKYLRFFVGRDDATQELIRATNLVMSEAVASRIQRKDRKAIMGAVHSIFTGAA